GGNMLSENNAVPRTTTIGENAIWVNDGGDGSFGPGDYFVFYAKGPTGWYVDSASGSFRHVKNLYDDKGYYFINFDTGPGKRVGSQQESLQANVTTGTANGYALYENDLFNPGKYGKAWYGEEFGTDGGRQDTREIEMEIGPAVEATFKIGLASRCPAKDNNFSLWLDNVQLPSVTIGPSFTNDDDKPVETVVATWSGAYSNPKPKLKFTYQPGTNNCIGYLDFVEVNTKQALYFGAETFTFRDWVNVKPGNIVNYQISNASAATQVWDVTDPHNAVRMNGTLNGSTYSFNQGAGTLHEFAAMKSGALPVPEYVSTVPNQNLVGSEAVDYLIVTHPSFLNSANELAEFHRQRSGLRVLVATTQQVYNEFSSGGQDISAIRDLARYFYERAGSDTNQFPRYLLLMGDASYDYKDRVKNNTNFVPTFESAQSLISINSFLNDDFFGMLDDNENIENTSIANTLDVGVGRLPVKTPEEANAVVRKIINYKSVASLGPWRLSTTLISDDEDVAGEHMTHEEIMDTIIVHNSDIYNHTKVYLDAIPTISTPGGLRAPNANKAINDQVFKGTLLLNYSGHGNTRVLAEERILTQDDYNKWKNMDKLPFMVTATCDFGRFDHPEYVSAGEELVLKKDGGVIAMVVTTHLVYAYANLPINKEFLDAQFQHINGRWNTFGDAFRIGKNVIYANAATSSDIIVNFRKFALLGDPALEPNFPEFFINTESVLDGVTQQPVDSIGALGSYIINGNVADVNDKVLEGFNGRLSLTFYDKPRTVSVNTHTKEKKFQVRNNIIYKGKATVTNGRFSRQNELLC
ncbi:MAG: hypothetical protein K0R82_1159, partial [Flavipsychrobacter sp.]|nr:hypothetical protein [Flavipsychrobacter sp.]